MNSLQSLAQPSHKMLSDKQIGRLPPMKHYQPTLGNSGLPQRPASSSGWRVWNVRGSLKGRRGGFDPWGARAKYRMLRYDFLLPFQEVF